VWVGVAEALALTRQDDVANREEHDAERVGSTGPATLRLERRPCVTYLTEIIANVDAVDKPRL
jgi:hypothetical protein